MIMLNNLKFTYMIDKNNNTYIYQFGTHIKINNKYIDLKKKDYEILKIKEEITTLLLDFLKK